MSILKNLAGARTYLIAIAASLVGVYMATDDLLVFLGVADLPNIPDYILVMLGAGGAASLRAAVK